MSYSLSATAPGKGEVLMALETKFAEEVLKPQPVHAKDRDAAFANVRRHLALAAEPDAAQDVCVSMHGSISVEGERVTICSSGCSVWLAQRPAASS